VIKQEFEPQISKDIYTTVPLSARPFLFTPDITSASEVTFSARFEEGRALIAHSLAQEEDEDESEENLDKKLNQLRSLSSQWSAEESTKGGAKEEKGASKKEGSKPKGQLKKRIVPRSLTTSKSEKKRSAPKKREAAKVAAPIKKRKVHLRRKKVK
jgi:hypothetical protein